MEERVSLYSRHVVQNNRQLIGDITLRKILYLSVRKLT